MSPRKKAEMQRDAERADSNTGNGVEVQDSDATTLPQRARQTTRRPCSDPAATCRTPPLLSRTPRIYASAAQRTPAPACVSLSPSPSHPPSQCLDPLLNAMRQCVTAAVRSSARLDRSPAATLSFSLSLCVGLSVGSVWAFSGLCNAAALCHRPAEPTEPTRRPTACSLSEIGGGWLGALT